MSPFIVIQNLILFILTVTAFALEPVMVTLIAISVWVDSFTESQAMITTVAEEICSISQRLVGNLRHNTLWAF